jgi:hypothetical protein
MKTTSWEFHKFNNLLRMLDHPSPWLRPPTEMWPPIIKRTPLKEIP